MNVIIIEDEPRTANDLKGILLSLDNSINVLTILPSVCAAVNWLQSNPAPELIFSDIQLGDGLSFEIFKEVQLNSPVIFCTAFDEYAIDAFESNSIDYLLKPIEEDRVEKSLQKFHRVKGHYNTSNQAGNLDKAISQITRQYKQSLLVHYREKIIPVKVTDICLVYAANGLVSLHMADKQQYTVQYTIEQLESMLDPNRFFRANRRLVVHTTCLAPETIIVSRLKANDFLRWIE